jgi:5'-3' exonuclease
MGIPSYFSFIAKNYSRVLEKLSLKTTCHNLYLDCNSIVYDAVYSMTSELSDPLLTPETKNILIIERTLAKIDEYILAVVPSNAVLIAFDGVAPAAKMNQQRSRRARAAYISQISDELGGKQSAWDTTQITPGTEFMDQLSRESRKYFNDPQKYKLKKLIVSPGDESGEGEHKIFEYIRANDVSHMTEKTVIYGLDADLIMLAINHLRIVPNIFLYRETPHFMKSISSDIDPNCAYLLNIQALSEIIASEVGVEQLRVTDYTFICFFLGNDFLPHFPSINIRTGGIDKMMAAYATDTCIHKTRPLTDKGRVNWGGVRKIVTHLADTERKYFIAEVAKRDRYRPFTSIINSPSLVEDKLLALDNLPTTERALEKSIAPTILGWEDRYYRLLFGFDKVTELRKKQICVNYLEGLEWVAAYYSVGCPDWDWTYKYNYPPLLTDLLRYIPSRNTIFIQSNNSVPVSPLAQLSRVIPKSKVNLLPLEHRTEFARLHHNDKISTQWAFCRYFWEAHVDIT